MASAVSAPLVTVAGMKTWRETARHYGLRGPCDEHPPTGPVDLSTLWDGEDTGCVECDRRFKQDLMVFSLHLDHAYQEKKRAAAREARRRRGRAATRAAGK